MTDLLTWRLENGRSQQWLAEASGIERSRISRIERGERLPSWAEAKRLFEVTGGIVDANSFAGIASAPLCGDTSP